MLMKLELLIVYSKRMVTVNLEETLMIMKLKI